MIPGQISINDLLNENKSSEPIKRPRIGSCFSGVGMWELALKYLDIPHDHQFFIEFDKYPAASYKAIHGDIKNYGDVTKLNGDEVEDLDVFFYSPPCQAFSVAGKGLGAEDDRGLLFNDALRIIKAKKPKICIMENVKGLTSKKHSDFFKHIQGSLNRAGYTSDWKILNTKEHGVAQNRERIFIVSIRNDIYKGFSWPEPFDNGLRLRDFLEPYVDEKYFISKEKTAKLLEQLKQTQDYSYAIDANYYKGPSPSDMTKGCKRQVVVIPVAGPDYVEKRQNGRRLKEDGDPMFTLTSQDRHGVLIDDTQGFDGVRIYKNESPCLRSQRSGLKVFEATKQGYAIAHEGDSINLEHPNSETRRGRVGVGVGVAQTLTTSCNQAVVEPNEKFVGVWHHPFSKKQEFNGYHDKECQTLLATDHKAPKTILECVEPNAVKTENSRVCFKNDINQIGNIIETESFGGNPQRGRIYSIEGISPALNTVGGGGLEPKILKEYRIRKLTPKECWRLQGIKDEDFEKAEKVNSNSQLYKQAGNGVSVNVVMELIKMLIEYGYIEKGEK